MTDFITLTDVGNVERDDGGWWLTATVSEVTDTGIATTRDVVVRVTDASGRQGFTRLVRSLEA